jgi:hypothetical protein
MEDDKWLSVYKLNIAFFGFFSLTNILGSKLACSDQA